MFLVQHIPSFLLPITHSRKDWVMEPHCLWGSLLDNELVTSKSSFLGNPCPWGTLRRRWGWCAHLQTCCRHVQGLPGNWDAKGRYISWESQKKRLNGATRDALVGWDNSRALWERQKRPKGKNNARWPYESRMIGFSTRGEGEGRGLGIMNAEKRR